MARKNIGRIAIGDLTPWAKDARTHSKKQIRQIAESIEAFGFTNPVLIDERRTILAGHGRVAAAKELGMTEVPCLRLDHMSDDGKRAYVLADEWLRTAMDYKIEWDRELDRRKRLGITDLPDPVPHPDHVKIDLNTGEARVEGPWTRKEKAELDMWLAKRDEWEADLAALQDDLAAEESEGLREIIRDDIKHAKHAQRVLSVTGQLTEGFGR